MVLGSLTEKYNSVKFQVDKAVSLVNLFTLLGVLSSSLSCYFCISANKSYLTKVGIELKDQHY